MSSSQTTTNPPIPTTSSNGGAVAGAAAQLQASGLLGTEGTSTTIGGIDSNQILNLLRHLPGVFNRLVEQGKGSTSGNLTEDAAAVLSTLSQPQAQYTPLAFPDPGPSSHPRGPPNLGQVPVSAARTEMDTGGTSTDEEGQGPPGGTPTAGRQRGKSASMSQDEWARMRKDNHKEVERRRRGNINEGINELGRIVPNGTGEKAKGAILSRAVQYIHHLKENEARNIEKWTLEKLLMDQAMGDLQSQLEDVKNMYQREKQARERAEAELAILKGVQERMGSAGGEERRRAREDEDMDVEGDRDGKRQRVE